jgi:hypothetical protein
LIALLGRQDTPTDGLEDYCTFLGEALSRRGVGLQKFRVDFAGRGGHFVPPRESLGHLRGHFRRGGSVGRIVFVQQQNVHDRARAAFSTRQIF